MSLGIIRMSALGLCLYPHCIMAGCFDLSAKFSAGGLHATPSSVWIYLLILVLNTLGNVSDKLRVLSAL